MDLSLAPFFVWSVKSVPMRLGERTKSPQHHNHKTGDRYQAQNALFDIALPFPPIQTYIHTCTHTHTYILKNYSETMGTQTHTRKQICVCFTLKFQEEQLPLLCLLTIADLLCTVLMYSIISLYRVHSCLKEYIHTKMYCLDNYPLLVDM